MKQVVLIGIVMLVVLASGCAGNNAVSPQVTDTATSAPLLDGKGFSSSGPASAGDTVAFTESAGGVTYSGRLTLEEVLRGTAAYNKIKQSYPSNLINIQSDREFMLVRFKYELVDTSGSGSTILVNRNSFNIYRNGQYDAEDNRYIIGATPDLYGNVKKGESVDGWFAFTVPKSAASPLVVYGKTTAGSNGIWFKTG